MCVRLRRDECEEGLEGEEPHLWHQQGTYLFVFLLELEGET